jgi:predicted MFS family arabinose efflux permease
VLAASGPAERRTGALSVYYLAAPVSMVVAAPLGLWLFRHVGVGANFTMVTILGLVAAACGLGSSRSAVGRRPAPAGSSPLWSRAAVPLSIVLAVSAMGQSALYAFLPLHVTSHGHERHLPWFFGVYSGGMIVFRVSVSAIANRWGRSQILVPALGCLAAGLGVLIPPPTPAHLAVAAVLLAAGSSALYPLLVALVVDRVPDRERGVAMGTVSGAWDLGAFAGSLLIAAVVEHSSHGAGFATAAALIVIALGALLLVEHRPRDLRSRHSR